MERMLERAEQVQQVPSLLSWQDRLERMNSKQRPGTPLVSGSLHPPAGDVWMVVVVVVMVVKAAALTPAGLGAAAPRAPLDDRHHGGGPQVRDGRAAKSFDICNLCHGVVRYGMLWCGILP